MCVYARVCWFIGVSTSHADDEMGKMYVPAECKSQGYMCSLHVAALHATLTRPRLSPSLADTLCTIYHGSDILL